MVRFKLDMVAIELGRIGKQFGVSWRDDIVVFARVKPNSIGIDSMGKIHGLDNLQAGSDRSFVESSGFHLLSEPLRILLSVRNDTHQISPSQENNHSVKAIFQSGGRRSYESA
jgi:hypothetical protein